MIDHVSVAVRDLARSTAFYRAVLAPIGLQLLTTRERSVGFGKTYPEFWLNARPERAPAENNPGSHVCLRAPSKDAVEAFHQAALANGGSDAGPPGERQAAQTVYFAAFINDPDGNKIEAATFPRPGEG